MREWFTLPGRDPDYCPFCGNDLVHERPRRLCRRDRLRNPDHRLDPRDRRLIGGVEYAFDRYTCHNHS